MKIIISLILSLLFCSNSIYSQTLDYARDIFFFEGQGKKIRDFYYYYSPLSAYMQNYNGRGLNVVFAGKKGSPIKIGESNIKLELHNYGYLRDLIIIQDLDELIKHINESKVDVIIVEEDFKEKIKEIALAKGIVLMVYKGFASINKHPKHDKSIPELWHYSFKLNSISRELRLIWNAREKYRNFYLYASQSKEYLIYYQNFIWLGIFVLGLIVFSLYGFILRWKNSNKKIILFWAGGTVLCISGYIAFSIVSKIYLMNDYYRQVQVSRVENRLSKSSADKNLTDEKLKEFLAINRKNRSEVYGRFSQIVGQLKSKDTLTVVGALRALTEISMDSKLKGFIKINEQEIFEKLKVLIAHKDARVRMWILTLIEKNQNFEWLKYMMDKNIKDDPSYLVRSRYVRNLEYIQKTETLNELRLMLKKEKHPYVLGEIKVAFTQRGILSP